MNRDDFYRARDPRDAAYDRDRDDFGQADYSRDYAYDPQTRTGYRVDPRRDGYPEPERAHDPRDDPRRDEARTFTRDDRRRGATSSDRVLWAVVTERLERAHRIDVSGIEVRVEDGVVFLDGVARNRAEKRRAEDLVEVDGVRDVVNGLRLREHGGWRRAFGR